MSDIPLAIQKLTEARKSIDFLFPELTQAIEAASAALQESSIDWVWPTDFRSVAAYASPFITQFFGDDPARYSMFDTPGHEGLDIRTGGTGKILAAYDGIVYRVERDEAAGLAYGRHVRMSHVLADGRAIKTLYGHMSSISVEANSLEIIKAGTVLGVTGSTGNSSAVHLHFNTKDATDGKYLDPLEFIRAAYLAAGGIQAVSRAILPPKVYKP